MTGKVLDCNSNIFGNLAQQKRRYVSTRMKRHRGTPAVWMSILLVGPTLPDLTETEFFQNPTDLPRLEHRNVAHAYGTLTV